MKCQTAPARTRGPAFQEPDDQPMLVKVKPFAVGLRLYHRQRALPAFRVALPRAEARQLAEMLLAALDGRGPSEFLLGFDEALLALHGLPAVQALESEVAR